MAVFDRPRIKDADGAAHRPPLLPLRSPSLSFSLSFSFSFSFSLSPLAPRLCDGTGEVQMRCILLKQPMPCSIYRSPSRGRDQCSPSPWLPRQAPLRCFNNVWLLLSLANKSFFSKILANYPNWNKTKDRSYCESGIITQWLFMVEVCILDKTKITRFLPCNWMTDSNSFLVWWEAPLSRSLSLARSLSLSLFCVSGLGGGLHFCIPVCFMQ